MDAAVVVMLLAAVMMGVPLRALAVETEHWRSVKGAALRTLFQDKEFADGVHFAYQFKAGGTFTGTEMSKRVSGSWRVQGNEFCWKWVRPPDPEECYAVQQDGAHVRLLINGSEAWYGTLQKLP